MVKRIVAVVISIVVIFTVLIGIYIASIYKVEYKDIVQKYAKVYSIDESLVYAIIKVESDYNTNAVSKAGARGLMQILPTTAIDICGRLDIEYSGVDMLYEADTNIHLGCYYIRYLIDMFGSEKLALASYNAGLSYVKAWLQDTRYSKDGKTLDYIPFKETREYVSRVTFSRMVYEYIV